MKSPAKSSKPAVANPLASGRVSGGKFAPGNAFACGPKPGVAIANQHRRLFWAALKTSDVLAALDTIRKILRDPKAKNFEKLAAAREMLDRIIGRPAESDLLERLEKLEEQAAQHRANSGATP